MGISMRSLRVSRLEVSQASSEDRMLGSLALGSMEHDLVRRVDLSFDQENKETIPAYLYRSYRRASDWALTPPDPDYGSAKDRYYVHRYHQEQAALYHNWASSYYDIVFSFDPSVSTQSDVYAEQWLVWDLYLQQQTGLLPITLQSEFDPVVDALRQPSSIDAYRANAESVRLATQLVQQHAQSRDKIAACLGQLNALWSFCEKLAGLVQEYHRPIPEEPQHAGVRPLSYAPQAPVIQQGEYAGHDIPAVSQAPAAPMTTALTHAR